MAGAAGRLPRRERLAGQDVEPGVVGRGKAVVGAEPPGGVQLAEEGVEDVVHQDAPVARADRDVRCGGGVGRLARQGLTANRQNEESCGQAAHVTAPSPV